MIALDESLHGWERETPLYCKLWALVISLGFMFATGLSSIFKIRPEYQMFELMLQ